MVSTRTHQAFRFYIKKNLDGDVLQVLKRKDLSYVEAQNCFFSPKLVGVEDQLIGILDEIDEVDAGSDLVCQGIDLKNLCLASLFETLQDNKRFTIPNLKTLKTFLVPELLKGYIVEIAPDRLEWLTIQVDNVISGYSEQHDLNYEDPVNEMIRILVRMFENFLADKDGDSSFWESLNGDSQHDPDELDGSDLESDSN